MTKISSALCAALALSFTVGTAVPLAAAPTFLPKAPSVSSDVIDVQNRRERRRDRFERRGSTYYYNGRRGYSYKRPGYRQHNGFWFPATAFIAGAIIGGALSNNNGGGSHVSWCSNRWRSYRGYDNSYQPNYGPRRVCVSPYG